MNKKILLIGGGHYKSVLNSLLETNEYLQIGSNVYIVEGSVIKQHVKIGSSTTIGMTSIVVKNIGSRVIEFGNPFKEVKSL